MKRYDYEYSPHQAVYYILDRKRGHGDYRPYDRSRAGDSAQAFAPPARCMALCREYEMA